MYMNEEDVHAEARSEYRLRYHAMLDWGEIVDGKAIIGLIYFRPRDWDSRDGGRGAVSRAV